MDSAQLNKYTISLLSNPAGSPRNVTAQRDFLEGVKKINDEVNSNTDNIATLQQEVSLTGINLYGDLVIPDGYGAIAPDEFYGNVEIGVNSVFEIS